MYQPGFAVYITLGGTVLLRLEIETHDRFLGFEIMGTNSLASGASISAPGGAVLRYEGSLVRKALGIPEVLQFLVEASINVDLALFATWLYEKVKAKPVARIVINCRTLTEITEDGIRQILEEEIRHES